MPSVQFNKDDMTVTMSVDDFIDLLAMQKPAPDSPQINKTKPHRAFCGCDTCKR